MARTKMSIFFYTIVGLAVIGIFTKLFTSPTEFFKSILIMIGVGVLLFVVAYLILNRGQNRSNNEMKRYKQAVKQSQLKYKSNPSDPSSKTKTYNQIGKIKKNRPPHLRVIHGNKPKKKDRATY